MEIYDVLPQLLLIPVLFMAQEMTVRLGLVTGKGHGELIRENFGRGWAILSAGTLAISAIGALLTEFAGIAGVGELWGISKWLTVPLATVLLIAIAFCGSYRRVEKIGIGLGLGELFFIIALLMIHPSLTAIGHGLITVPYRDPSYLYLVAANVGAVVMPWMIFYQQGAIVDKQLTVADLKQEQHDTAAGTFITQGIMILFVVVFAAATSRYHAVNGLQSVEDLAKVLSPFLGAFNARMLLSLSLLGGALVAALVVALAGTWGITEVLNWPHSLNEKLNRNNYGFYLIYILAHVIGAGLVLINFNLLLFR